MTSAFQEWEPTRAAALAALEEFVPNAGHSYAHKRNFERGRGNHSLVSRLSPWISLRVISEKEVVDTVLATHSLEAAQKFVDEVCWRTYWKGWLQLRPWVWDEFVGSLNSALEWVESERVLSERYNRALSASTGIDPVDEWLSELFETGYLHNHARMWLASIWIYVFELPWELGAALFYRHLLDADAASNTLSWRWVAGLHTDGKRYIPDASGINHWTEGRVQLSEDLFLSSAPPASITHDPPLELEPLAAHWQVSGPSALVLHEDDLFGGVCTERLKSDLEACGVTSIVCLRSTPQHALLSPAGVRKQFVDGCVSDALRRISAVTGQVGREVKTAEALHKWSANSGLSVMIAFAPFTGEVNDFLQKPPLAGSTPAGLQFHFVRRTWDADFFPFATKGFFRFRKQIPKLIGG